MSLLSNEQAKLTANRFDSLAAGIIITGAIAPAVALIHGFQGSTQTRYAVLGLLSVAWVGLGIALHLFARRLLRGLRPRPGSNSMPSSARLFWFSGLDCSSTGLLRTTSIAPNGIDRFQASSLVNREEAAAETSAAAHVTRPALFNKREFAEDAS